MMQDKGGRAQMNIICINDNGAVFIEAVNCKAATKSGVFIVGVLRPIIERIGAEHVVALCTDGGSNYKAAGKLLQKEWPHLDLVPCATHVLDLLMEDIGKMDWAQVVVTKANNMISFVWGHQWTRTFMRSPELHGKEKSLQVLRPAGTHFGTQFIAVSRLRAVLQQLTAMVTHKDWAEKGGEHADGIRFRGVGDGFSVVEEGRILNPANQEEGIFLQDAECTKVMQEWLERQMAFVNTYWKKSHGKKGPVRPLHEGVTAYINGEGGFGTQTAIDGRGEIQLGTGNVMLWWQYNGWEYADLARFARRTLSQAVSASPCEWNWSTWDGVHTTRRNRLGSEKVRDLVYVAQNWNVVHNFHKDAGDARPSVLEEDGEVEVDEDDVCFDEWEKQEEQEKQGEEEEEEEEEDERRRARRRSDRREM
ncbi:unnamed protein product [Closterium sp. NIES-54]